MPHRGAGLDARVVQYVGDERSGVLAQVDAGVVDELAEAAAWSVRKDQAMAFEVRQQGGEAGGGAASAVQQQERWSFTDLQVAHRSARAPRLEDVVAGGNAQCLEQFALGVPERGDRIVGHPVLPAPSIARRVAVPLCSGLRARRGKSLS